MSVYTCAFTCIHVYTYMYTYIFMYTPIVHWRYIIYSALQTCLNVEMCMYVSILYEGLRQIRILKLQV